MSKIIRDGGLVKNLCFDPIPVNLSKNKSTRGDKPDLNSEEIIAEALSTADLIIKDAETRVSQIEYEARRKGHSEGLEMVRTEMVNELEIVKSVARQALEEKWRLINSYESNIVDLAINVAEKIIGEQVKIDTKVIVNVAKKALIIAGEREHIQIRVNPEDLELMRVNKEVLMASMDGIQKIEVVSDRRVKRGGCIFETSIGNVDARIESQLSQVEQSLREVVSGD